MAEGEEPARAPERARPSRSLRFWLIGATTLAFLAVVVGALAALQSRHRVDGHQDELRSQLRPAQLAGQGLELAYVDQQSGHRGYVYTGNPAFLAPYRVGQKEAGLQQASLQDLLVGYDAALADLASVEKAGQRWTAHAEARQALVRSGRAMSEDRQRAWEARGSKLFDDLRARLSTLNGELDRLVQAEVQRLVDSRTVSDRLIVVDVVGVGLALVVVLFVLWGMLTRPLRRLVAAMSQVAHHSYENPIPVEGPSELREIASAAETMRESVIAQTSALAVAEQNLTIRAERDRVAADLHDLTIQRVFALGMRLSGLGARHPRARADLDELVDEADIIIKELRAIIFELGQDNRGLTLRDRLTRLMGETAPTLGLAPVLEIRGDLERCSSDLANDIMAVVREALSNVARHARASSVSVLAEATPTGVRLEIADDGVGLVTGTSTGNGLTNLRSRARRHGGDFVVRSGDGNGTTLLWSVPWEETR